MRFVRGRSVILASALQCQQDLDISACLIGGLSFIYTFELSIHD